MYKIFLTILLGSALCAELVDGIAIIVKGEAITLHELKKEMTNSNISVADASNVLIRKKLEAVEAKERKLKVSTVDVYDDIKKTAANNGMSVSEFYEAVRADNGMSSEEFKAKTKEKLLAQKLYNAISYSSMAQPHDEEIREYFDMHIKEFEHPNKFNVMIYRAKDKATLEGKISNPMFFSASIKTEEQQLEYNKIPRDLGNFLSSTDINSFSPIIPDGKGNYMSFFVQEKIDIVEVEIDTVKAQISNILMSDKREQVLSDYFARLRGNSEIKTLRLP
ncbi:peptidylprolyl isomerase [Sulfurimonas sp.]|nr:peptidylprolyl isomerase [Sulfurimonas sp.]